MPKPFARVRAAATDGRLATPFWRQEQLQKLHAGLVKSASALKTALVQDTGNTTTEAQIELTLALNCVRDHFKALDPAKELQKEYRLAHAKDADDRREPVGIVRIVATSHTPVFSVVSALAGVIASGNCAILELPQSTAQVSDVLKKTLEDVVDTDILEFAESTASGSDVPEGCYHILQDDSDSGSSVNNLSSPSKARVIAVVDRSADIPNAAKAIAAARLSFSGSSPYAPDVVLVNEFVKKEFLNALLEASFTFMSGDHAIGNGHSNGNGGSEKNSKSSDNQWVDQLRKENAGTVVTSGSSGTVLNVEKRSSTLLREKVTGPTLAVHATKSMDDAIDLANSGDVLLASYAFGTPDTVKYLGQFMTAHANFANHIPYELLVGPAAPLNHPVIASTRYSTEMFTVPRPQYASESAQSVLIKAAMSGSSKVVLAAMHDAAMTSLEPAKKRPGNQNLGFFERGIFLGLGTGLLGVIASTTLLVMNRQKILGLVRW